MNTKSMKAVFAILIVGIMGLFLSMAIQSVDTMTDLGSLRGGDRAACVSASFRMLPVVGRGGSP